jgi:hypothetical protein
LYKAKTTSMPKGLFERFDGILAENVCGDEKEEEEKG